MVPCDTNLAMCLGEDMHCWTGGGTGLGIYSQEHKESEKSDVQVGPEREEGQLVEKRGAQLEERNIEVERKKG